MENETNDEDFDCWPEFIVSLPKAEFRFATEGQRMRYERNQKICEEYRAGATAKELSVKYGLTPPAIYGIVYMNGGIKHPARDNFDRDAAICADYQNGMMTPSLAAKYNLTRERVCQILRRGNLIEHRKERRAAAREMLAAETEAIRAATKAAFAEQLQIGMEHVRSGASISEATRRLGWGRSREYVLSASCKQAGIKQQYGRGRGRDREPIKRRARELRGEGRTWADISRVLFAEGYGVVSPPWFRLHLPDLVRGYDASKKLSDRSAK